MNIVGRKIMARKLKRKIIGNDKKEDEIKAKDKKCKLSLIRID